MKGSVKTKSSPKSKPIISDEQQALLRQIISSIGGDFLGGIPDALISGFPTFNEPVPGLSPLEGMSLAGMEALASGKASGAAGSEQFAQGRSALGDILTQGPQDINEYFKRTVEDPTLESVRETAIPGIRGSAVGSGNLFSGQTRTQESQLYEDVYDTLGRERTRVGFDERARDMEMKLAATQALVGLQQGEVGYLGGLQQAGAGQRAAEVQQYSLRLAEFVRQLEERDKRLAFLSQLSTTPTRGIGQSTTQGWGELLEGMGQNLNDAAGAVAMGIAACHCAAVYYPWFSREWRSARQWILFGWGGLMGKLFRRVYKRYSRTFAAFLLRHKLARRALRPFFAWAARRGEE